MMQLPVPKLLVGEYASLDGIKDRICNNHFKPLDTTMPTCRFRGTFVETNDTDKTITIVGWQRNVTRLQKMDISLPTIITAVISKCSDENAFRIVSVELDTSFKGSRGILCSTRYLDRNMKEALIGRIFDTTLLKAAKLKALHCFHLVEVLYGMISYFGIIRDALSKETSPKIHYEEETIDYHQGDDNRSYCCGMHSIEGRDPVRYCLVLTELLEKTGFTKDGSITFSGSLSYEFLVREREVCRGTIPNAGNNLVTVGFQKMLLECIKAVQYAFGIDSKKNMYFTNLYPAAFIGLCTQMLAVRHFSNNYQYIMHVLAGLQRQNNIPLCIGSAVNIAEVKQYFPGFSPDDLKG